MTAVATAQSDSKKNITSELVLRMPQVLSGDDVFFEFCKLNPEMRIERNELNEIIIMAPTSTDTGNRNFEIAGELAIWNRKTQLGKGFDSSTGFKLPNGAERSPDLAWIRNDRWEALSEEQRRKFAPIAPDFVLELRSADQSLIGLKEKMEEYIACGCRLGWLIDPQARKTFTYSENGDIQTIPFEDTLSGGEVLPGFEMVLGDLFK